MTDAATSYMAPVPAVDVGSRPMVMESAPAPCRSGDPDFMTSLARGLRVIRAFSGATGGLTIAELSRATGLNRAVVRRCLYTLCELGYAEADGRQYFLQPSILNVGLAYLSSSAIPTAARPILEELSHKLGEETSVGILDGGAVVSVARAGAKPATVVESFSIGCRMPVYCTAPGRVLLANLSSDRVALELSRLELLPHTRRTITSRSRLEAILSQVRSDDFAVSEQELVMGLRSIAVPVRNTVGVVVAAMNVSTHVARVSRDALIGTCLPLLKTAAVRLGRQLPLAG